MSTARRALTMALVALGVYYVVVGIATLVDLPQATARWIYRSNDGDFRHDVRLFTLLIGTGAAAAVLLGSATAVRGYRDLVGGRMSPAWGWLFIASVVVHAPAFLYKVVSGGRLAPDDFRLHVLLTAARFLLTTLAFGFAWWLADQERRRTSSAPPVVSSNSLPRPL